MPINRGLLFWILVHDLCTCIIRRVLSFCCTISESTWSNMLYRTLQLRHCVADVFDTNTDEDKNIGQLLVDQNLAWFSTDTEGEEDGAASEDTGGLNPN